jgi:hypothetical protein
MMLLTVARRVIDEGRDATGVGGRGVRLFDLCIRLPQRVIKLRR